MTFTESIATSFRNYAVFRGCASRPEFWGFVLFLVVLLLGFAFVAAAFSSGGGRPETASATAAVVILVAYLAMILPYLAAW